MRALLPLLGADRAGRCALALGVQAPAPTAPPALAAQPPPGSAPQPAPARRRPRPPDEPTPTSPAAAAIRSSTCSARERAACRVADGRGPGGTGGRRDFGARHHAERAAMLVAMVQGPDKKTYIVHQGDKLLDGTMKTVTAAGARHRPGSQRSAVAGQAAGNHASCCDRSRTPRSDCDQGRRPCL